MRFCCAARTGRPPGQWRIALLPLLGLAQAASAAEIESLQVSRGGARYHVEMEVRLQAPAAASYAAFAAPANLPAINPAVQRVQVLNQAADGGARIYTEVRVCAALYCKTLHQTQQMRYAPRPDGGDLHAEVLPAQSDFSYGRADWRFRSDGGATRLHFSADLEPAFWVPPLIGPWLVERSLRQEAQRSSAGIERMAAAPAPRALPGAAP